jgi:WD40 repeat protein
VASGGLDLKVKIWDPIDGKELHSLEGHACFVNAIAFSPDGKRLASASGSDFTATSFVPCNDNTVKLWDVSSGQLIRTFSPHVCHVDTVTFLTGNRVVTASGNEYNSPCSDHTIKIWNIESGETIHTIDTGYVGKISAVAVLQNGARILAGGQYQHPLEGGPDKGIRLWDAESGELIRTYDGRSKGEQAPGALETIGGVAVSPNSARMAGVQWGRQLKMWDVPSGQLVREFKWRSQYINSIAFSPDDTSLLSSDLFGAILWDAAKGNLERVFDENGKLDGFDTIQAVAYSPDGKAILMASGQRVKLFDIQSGGLILTLENSSQVQSVAFSDDGKFAVSASRDGAIKMWDLQSRKLSRVLNSGAGPGFGSVSATPSPDGSKVLAASYFKVLMWDVKSGAVVKEFSEEFASSLNSTAVKFSPNGNRVLFATWNNTMVLADTMTTNKILEFTGHEAPINSVAFTGNGARVLSGSSDATLKLWDTATGKLLRTFEGHGGPVLSVAFSHDGLRALSGSSDGTVKIWDVATGMNIITLIP